MIPCTRQTPRGSGACSGEQGFVSKCRSQSRTDEGQALSGSGAIGNGHQKLGPSEALAVTIYDALPGGYETAMANLAVGKAAIIADKGIRGSV